MRYLPLLLLLVALPAVAQTPPDQPAPGFDQSESVEIIDDTPPGVDPNAMKLSALTAVPIRRWTLINDSHIALVVVALRGEGQTYFTAMPLPRGSLESGAQSKLPYSFGTSCNYTVFMGFAGGRMLRFGADLCVHPAVSVAKAMTLRDAQITVAPIIKPMQVAMSAPVDRSTTPTIVAQPEERPVNSARGTSDLMVHATTWLGNTENLAKAAAGALAAIVALWLLLRRRRA